MRSTSVRPGSSFHTLLYIIVLCAIMALVPALAAGVKHAGGAVMRVFTSSDHLIAARTSSATAWTTGSREFSRVQPSAAF